MASGVTETAAGAAPAHVWGAARVLRPGVPRRAGGIHPWLGRYEPRALAVIFVAGLLVRVLFLERVPNTVTADELDFAGNAMQVLTGQGPGLFGLDWTPEPALSVYYLVWSWQLFGQTLFAERLVAALLTALSILPFYALTRRVVSAPSASLATILFAAARWYLLFSRSAWNNGHIVLYLLLAAWCLTKALETDRRRYWLGLGAALALLLYGYFAGRGVVLAFALYGGILIAQRLLARDMKGVARLLRGAGLAALVCALLFLPELPAILGNLDTFNRRTAAVYLFNQPLPTGTTALGVLGGQFWTTVRSFVFLDPTMGTGRYKGPGQSWLDPLSAALYLAGLVLAVRRGRELLLWWCLLLIPLGATQLLSVGTPDGARALPAVAPMLVFAALVIELVWQRTARVHWIPRPVAFELLLALALLAAGYNVASYARWVQSPASAQARQPAVPVAQFYTWRDFQLARLRDHLDVLPAGDYDQLAAAAIAAQIAGVPSLASATPAAPASNQPLSDVRQVATIGAVGDGAGQLAQPRDVAVDGQGTYAVVDTARRKVVIYAADGTFVREWGEADTAPGQLQQPWAIAAVPDGTYFVLDAQAGQVNRFDGQGQFLGVVAGLGNALNARGLTLGQDGQLFVAETAANRVARFTPTGAALPALPADAQNPRLFDQPTSVAVAANGTLFVYEPDSGRLELHAGDGRLLLATSAPKVDTVDAGGLAILPDGRVLLADANGHRVLAYSATGQDLGSFPVDGSPRGLTVTRNGLVAVADVQSRVVRVYALGVG